MNKLIKSKNRVKNYGEVFTPSSIVDKMVDLCEPVVSEINKRVLEPACGEGVFLETILKRRLNKCKTDYDRLVCASNIYGIDIQRDNVKKCRERLLSILKSESHDYYFLKAAEDIVTSNIIEGDTINKPDEIIFTFYEPVGNHTFKISKKSLSEMI